MCIPSSCILKNSSPLGSGPVLCPCHCCSLSVVTIFPTQKAENSVVRFQLVNFTRSRVTVTCHSDFVIQTAQTCKEGIKLDWNIQSESGLCDRLSHKFSGLKSMWSESFTCHWNPIESDVMCLVQIKETGSLYLRYLWPVYKTEMKIIHLSLKGEAVYCSESSG